METSDLAEPSCWHLLSKILQVAVSQLIEGNEVLISRYFRLLNFLFIFCCIRTSKSVSKRDNCYFIFLAIKVHSSCFVNQPEHYFCIPVIFCLHVPVFQIGITLFTL